MRRYVLVGLEVVVPLAVLAGIVLWSERAGSFFFPPASEAGRVFLDRFVLTTEGVKSEIWPSLYRIFAGYTVAVLTGVAVGTALALWPRARRMLFPVVEFMRAMPSPALIPFILLVFGVDDVGKVVLIAFACVWPILLNSIEGVAGCEPTLLETSKSYRIGAVRRILFVRLPAASPQIFAGMRTSLAIALILTVVAEMLAGTNGIGFFIIQAQSTFDMPSMWAGIILLGLLGYALNGLFLLLESRVLAWHRGAYAEVSV